ncbi:hypothetical protein IFM89_004350, partial [Coptis chinensis]
MVKCRREDPNGDESVGKWVRGTSTLPKVFDQPKGSKLELIWKGKQPVGAWKNPSLFSKSIGVLIATTRRFDWTKNWELQDGGRKQWLWDTIKESWELEETRKDPTLGQISGDEFRNKKSKWKRNFYTHYTTYEERLSHRPPQLSPEEWVHLVEFWDTPENQAISKRNKANRAKQIAKYTAGRISFPQFEEIMSEEAGAPPSLGDLFVRTHISLKTHDALDDQSRYYIDKMKELAGRDEEGTQQPLTNEIYREVMPPERHGCVRLKDEELNGTWDKNGNEGIAVDIVGIEGIVVGIVGNSTVDNDGNATFGIVGIVGIEGSVGKLVLGNGGIANEDCNCYSYDARKLDEAKCVHKGHANV